MVTMGLKCLSANCRVVCDNSIGVLLYAGSLFLTLSCGAGFIRTSSQDAFLRGNHLLPDANGCRDFEI